VVANGYIYVLGGNVSGAGSSAVYYAQLNSDGSTGVWQTNSSNPLPTALYGPSTIVSNGYIYAIGGANHDAPTTVYSTVYYASLNANGSTGAWQTNSSNPLPANRYLTNAIVANGFVYEVGGNTSNTVYYASTARLQVGANLDLVGLQSQTLSSSGNSSTGSTGGSITAGNGTFVGALQVQGQGAFAQGITVNGNITVGGSALFKNSANSTVAFQIQDAGGVSLFGIDTSNRIITIAGDTTTFANLTLSNAHFKLTQTTAPTIGTPSNCGTSPTAAVTAGSTDSAGSFTITAGTGSPTTCDVVISFNKAFGAAPKSVVITPTLAVGSATNQRVAYVSATSSTTFTIKINTNLTGNTPAASEVMSFYYWVVE
jgi:hypothetical protein